MAEQLRKTQACASRLALQEYGVAAIGGLLILVFMLRWYLCLCALVLFAWATRLAPQDYRVAPIIGFLIQQVYLLWCGRWFLMYLCALLFLTIVLEPFIQDVMSRPQVLPNGKAVIIPDQNSPDKSDAATNTSFKDFANLLLHEGGAAVKEDNLTLLSKDFEDLYNNQRFADVTLKLDKYEFPAHKVILRSRSKVFEAMFEHDMQENRRDTVDLVDMEAETVKDMIHYIYCGKVRRLLPEEALNLYVAADRYDLQQLVLRCRKIILNGLSIDSIGKISVVADLHNDLLLMESVKVFISKNLKEVLKTDTWMTFAENNPLLSLKLIRSAILNEY